MPCRHFNPEKFAFDGLSYLELKKVEHGKAETDQYSCKLFYKDSAMPYNTMLFTVHPDGKVEVADDSTGQLFGMKIEDTELITLNVRDKEDKEKRLKVLGNSTSEFLPHSRSSNSGPQLLEYVKNERPGCQPTFYVYLHSSPFPSIPVCHIIGFTVDGANMERTQRVGAKFDSALEQSCKMLVVAMILKLAITVYGIDVVIKRPVVERPQSPLSEDWIRLGESEVAAS